MKTISLLSAIAGIALITLPSCKKEVTEPAPITQTINTSVKVNETYSYTLPVSETPEPFTIVQQSQHSGTSVIEKNADGNFVYSYTPSADFNGKDVIILSNEAPGGPGQCGQPGCNQPQCNHNKPAHGNCDHKMPQKHIITINFTVLENDAVITTATLKK